MESETVAPATPTESAPVESTDAPVELSIAEHEAQFGPASKVEQPASDAPAEKPRHRAQSQRARASDVEDISSWTKRLREAEDAIPIERKDGESDRVYQLRRRAEIAELAKTYKTQPPAREQVAAPKSDPVPARAVPQPVPAGTAKPTWSAFEAKIGTQYTSWGDAQDAYVDARDDWRDGEQQRLTAARASEQAQEAAAKRDREVVAKHQERMASAAEQRADFRAVTDPIMNRMLPNPLLKAIATHDKGPDFVYALASDPDFLDDLFVLSHGKSGDDDEFVATLQRRLLKRVQAGTTGSAAPALPQRTAPRPPNPVRTGPLKSTDDLPDDDHSIAEHQRHWGRKR